MPRAALGALVAPLFVTLFRAGLLPEAHALLVGAQQQLGRRRDACVPAVEGARNPARELARRIGRTIPLIYGGGALGAVAAMRWKADVNENAKAPAFWNTHPELDHNEICGWGQHGDVTRQVLTLVELRHGFEHERLGAPLRRDTRARSRSAWRRCSRCRPRGRTASPSCSTSCTSATGSAATWRSRTTWIRARSPPSPRSRTTWREADARDRPGRGSVHLRHHRHGPAGREAVGVGDPLDAAPTGPTWARCSTSAAGKRLSLQMHDEKLESWFLMQGRAKVVWDDGSGELVETELEPGLGYSCCDRPAAPARRDHRLRRARGVDPRDRHHVPARGRLRPARRDRVRPRRARPRLGHALIVR